MRCWIGTFGKCHISDEDLGTKTPPSALVSSQRPSLAARRATGATMKGLGRIDAMKGNLGIMDDLSRRPRDNSTAQPQHSAPAPPAAPSQAAASQAAAP